MKILVLSTWFPYPPIQGSKIRAYNLIRSLSQQHELALISFRDMEIQDEWIEHLHCYCKEIIIVEQHPFRYSKIKTWLGFFTILPSAVVAGYSTKMAATVQKFAKVWQPDLVFALTFVTAPYALQIPHTNRVVDMDNLLALMLRDLFKNTQGFLQKQRRYWAYWKFKNYENQIYKKFDLAFVCSNLDKSRAVEYIDLAAEKIVAIPNGVDSNLTLPQSLPDFNHKLIFNGSLNYWPNYDAMNYFLTEIFPLILKKIPDCEILITGNNENVDIHTLPSHSGKVIFTGFVENIQSLVTSCAACVVPLRHGAGTRLKILEAMAAGTPVITTPKGAEGLEVKHGQHLLIANTPQEFANLTVQILSDLSLREKIVLEAQRLVENVYDWRVIGMKLNQTIDALLSSR
ncbi:MAG: glycosyltransferase family 4 protein [Chloroflexota bacterium]